LGVVPDHVGGEGDVGLVWACATGAVLALPLAGAPCCRLSWCWTASGQ